MRFRNTIQRNDSIFTLDSNPKKKIILDFFLKWNETWIMQK